MQQETTDTGTTGHQRHRYNGAPEPLVQRDTRDIGSTGHQRHWYNRHHRYRTGHHRYWYNRYHRYWCNRTPQILVQQDTTGTGTTGITDTGTSGHHSHLYKWTPRSQEHNSCDRKPGCRAQPIYQLCSDYVTTAGSRR